MLLSLLLISSSFAATLNDVFLNFEGVWTRVEDNAIHRVIQTESFEQMKDGVWYFQFQSNSDSFSVNGNAYVIIEPSDVEICRSYSQARYEPCVGMQKNQKIMPMNSRSFVWIVDTEMDLRIEVTYRLISETRMQKTISTFSSGLKRQIAQTIFYERVETLSHSTVNEIN